MFWGMEGSALEETPRGILRSETHRAMDERATFNPSENEQD